MAVKVRSAFFLVNLCTPSRGGARPPNFLQVVRSFSAYREASPSLKRHTRAIIPTSTTARILLQ